MIVLDVQNIWKRFTIPHERRRTVLDHVAGTFSFLVGKRYSYEVLWALKDVSLKVGQGKCFGIIGPNGSGKSTLLKIIASVMKPDKGTISVNGSVAPILELGLGFHPDLSVRENALIYGVLLGLSRSDVRKRIGSIMDFAGLQRFEDVQLKTLSSGMLIRLAFSIAIQAEPDIFLVDEVLTVGDAEFQQKCLQKFREFKQEKKSIVLVSHNLYLVKDFCEEALYLRNGQTVASGPSKDVTDQYFDDLKGSTGTAGPS